MMQLAAKIEFDDDHAMVLAAAEDFCAAHSPLERVRELLHCAHDVGHSGFDADVWQALVAQGWLGIGVPESLGGAGLGFGACVPLAAVMGEHLLATPFFSATLAAQALLLGGTQEQRHLWLPRVTEGCIGTLALLDDEDWGASLVGCRASLDGHGNLTLEGTKQLVCDAGVADFFVVSVSADWGSEVEPALVLVPRGELRDGAISPRRLVDETKRASTVDFTGVVLDSAAVLPDAESDLLTKLCLLGALLTAAEATGSAKAGLNGTVDYLQNRKQFGRPIGSFQSLKHPAAAMLCQWEDAQSLLYHAATELSAGFSVQAEVACRMAKVQASDTLSLVGDRAIQFHGAFGFTYECNAQLFARRALWSASHFGDAGLHRQHLADLLLTN